MATKEELKRQLLATDERALRRYALLHKIPGAKDRPLEELADLICARKDIAYLMEAATRLELKSFDTELEQKLRDHVESKLHTLDTKLLLVDEKIKVVDEKIKTSEEPGKRLDERVKGIQFATLVIGILGISFGGYTVWKLFDINERSANVQAAVEASVATFGFNRQVLIETNLEELAEFMERFVTSKPDPVLLARIDRRLEVLKRGSRAVIPSKESDGADAAMLSLLIRTYEGVQALRALSDSAANQMIALNEAERRWTEMAEILTTDGGKALVQRYSGHVQKMLAYRENLLGIVYVRKYVLSDRKSGHLKLAEERFEAAIKQSPSFFAAYNNLAVVLYDRYRAVLETPKPISDKGKESELRALIRRANDSIDKALEYSEGRPRRSFVYNTGAYYKLLEAELNEQTNNPAEAVRKVDEAALTIDKALKDEPVANVAYITKAEILCYGYSLKRQQQAARARLTAPEFTRLLETSLTQGYRWGLKAGDRDKFHLKDGRFLHRCKALFPTENDFQNAIDINVFESKSRPI